MPVEQQPPEILAMVIADTVVIDVTTDKKTIQGIFHSLTAESFPWVQPSIVVYAVFTEGYGATSLKLRLVDVDELRPPLFELETVVNFADPLDVLEVVFSQKNIVFPAPGEYRFQLFGAGQPLRERRLQVLAMRGLNQS